MDIIKETARHFGVNENEVKEEIEKPLQLHFQRPTRKQKAL